MNIEFIPGEELKNFKPLYNAPIKYKEDYNYFVFNREFLLNKIDWFVSYTKDAYSTCGNNSWNNGEIYFDIGLSEEIGELCGVIKRIFRGDYISTDNIFLSNLYKEMGDTLWYSAMILLKKSCFKDKNPVEVLKGDYKKFIVNNFPNWDFVVSDNIIKNIKSIRHIGDQIDIIFSTSKSLIENVFSILYYLSAICILYKIDISDIGLMNTVKLKERKEKNVIKGNGNDR